MSQGNKPTHRMTIPRFDGSGYVQVTGLWQNEDGSMSGTIKVGSDFDAKYPHAGADYILQAAKESDKDSVPFRIWPVGDF